MADIFISYKKEDAGRVIRIVEGLRAEGLSVWWDHGIQAGAQWDQTIQAELTAAQMVIAVWSEQSVGAPWVKEEAGVGKNKGKLLPVRIDNVDPPLGFTLIQAADLINWQGDTKDQRWGFFLDSVRAVLRGETPAGLERAPTRARKRGSAWPWIAAGVAGFAVLAVGLIWFATLGANVTYTETPGGQRTIAASRGGPQAPPAGPASANETKAWAQASEAKTRGGFQSYLVAYPNGAYAEQARTALLMCRYEARETWEPPQAPIEQGVRGVASIPNDGKTEAAVCAVAQKMALDQAKTNCNAITDGGGYRNAQMTINEAKCACSKTSEVATVCIVDRLSKCTWEMKLAKQVEICG